MMYGLIFGAAIGVVFGIALNSIGLGISFGAGTGIVFSLLFAKSKKKDDSHTP
jgi:ABC-type uncharacterized transport system permease subunit